MDRNPVPSEWMQHLATFKRLYQDELMAIQQIKAYMEKNHEFKKYEEEFYVQCFVVMGVCRIPWGVEIDNWSQHEPAIRYYYEEMNYSLREVRQIMKSVYGFWSSESPFEYLRKILSLGITKRNVNYHRRGHPHRREALAGHRAVFFTTAWGEHVAVATLPVRACTQPDIVDRSKLLPEQPGLQALSIIEGPQGFVALGAVGNNDTGLAACKSIHPPSPPSAPFENGSPSNNPLYQLMSPIESMNDQPMEYVEHANEQNEGATLAMNPQYSRGVDAKSDREWKATNKRRMGPEVFTAWENTEIENGLKTARDDLEREKLELKEQRERGETELERQRAELERQRAELERQRAGLKRQRTELDGEKLELKKQREREETELERQRTELDGENRFVETVWEKMIKAAEAWEQLSAGTGIQSPFSDRWTSVEGRIPCADDLSAERTNGPRRSARTRKPTRTGP